MDNDQAPPDEEPQDEPVYNKIVELSNTDEFKNIKDRPKTYNANTGRNQDDPIRTSTDMDLNRTGTKQELDPRKDERASNFETNYGSIVKSENTNYKLNTINQSPNDPSTSKLIKDYQTDDQT